MKVERIAGADRYSTSVAVASVEFPDPFPAGEGTVYLARGDVLADALAAGTLADGPILLVPSCGRAPRSVVDEVARLDPARVVALGGTGAVCSTMLSDVAGDRPVERLAGEDRYATARAIANERLEQAPAPVVYIASGSDAAPDAVAGGVLTGGPILTVSPRGGSSVSKAAEWVAAHPTVKAVTGLGGTSTLSEGLLSAIAGEVPVNRLAGIDRHATAAAIGQFQFAGVAPVVYLARSDVFADAVAAGSLTGGPVLLTRSCSLPQAVTDALATLRPSTVVALGGTSAICDSLLEQAAAAVPIEQNQGVVVEPGVKTLDEEALAEIDGFDPESGELLLSNSSRLGATLSEGGVIAAGVGPETPEGMLRKVVDVQITPSGYEVHTEQATLTDAIANTNGPLTATGDLVSAAATGSSDAAVLEGGAAAPGEVAAPLSRYSASADMSDASSSSETGAAIPLGTFRFGVESEFSRALGSDTLKGEGTIKVSGEVEVSASAEAVIDIGITGLNRARIVVTPTATMEAVAEFGGGVEGELTKKIASAKRVWHVQIGPVPLVITDESALELKVTVGADGTASVSSTVSAGIATGFDYTNGNFHLIADPTASYEPFAVDASVALRAKISIGPVETIKLYGIVGITGGVGPYIEGSAKFSATDPPECTVDVGLESKIGVVAGIEIAGIKLTDTWEQARFAELQIVDWTGACETLDGWTGTGHGANPLTIVTTTLPSGEVGADYSAHLVSDGEQPPVAWSTVAGSLPSGLSLSAAGEIHGVPTDAGASTFTVSATDGAGQRAMRDLTLTIREAGEQGEPVVFEDSNLETCIRAEFSSMAWAQEHWPWLYPDFTEPSASEPLRSTDLELLEALDCLGLVSLTGLEWATRLGSLVLSDFGGSELDPIAGLTGLYYFQLIGSEVSDLGPLRNLVGLTTLEIHSSPVRDLTPISELTAVQWLDLIDTEVADLTPLADMTSMYQLHVSESPNLSDVSPLAGMTELRTLGLRENPLLTSLAPLSTLTQVSYLDIHDDDLTSLEGLQNMTQLSYLQADRNRITSIEPLANAASLVRLRLSGNQIGSIAALSDKPELEHLEINANRISDLSPIADLPKLRYVEAFFNRITDLSMFAENPTITQVSAGEQKIGRDSARVGESVTLPVFRTWRGEVLTPWIDTATSEATATLTGDPSTGMRLTWTGTGYSVIRWEDPDGYFYGEYVVPNVSVP
ncbi:cell wall-binding repeat-containing protein [Agromyces sp. ZXT2-3]|uniref:cell wall-binding repeat-containing protein n=1 Tax=Agromyces sp. ZXT2-3 TaxID=3461152 RepID=UPI004054A055